MQGHGTLFLCDACGRAFPDQSSKEILYQVDKVRYRQELCPTCLDAEIRRHDGRRGIPGFRKRAATVVKIRLQTTCRGRHARLVLGQCAIRRRVLYSRAAGLKSHDYVRA